MTTVKLSSRNQIVIPSKARKVLKLKVGDRLVVDVQGDVLILIPVPASYADNLDKITKVVWDGVKVKEYLGVERDTWTD